MKKISIIFILFAFHLEPYCLNSLLDAKKDRNLENKWINSSVQLNSYNNESFNTEKFIDKAIHKYQKKIAKNAFITSAHYIERSKIDGEYQMFTEGLGYLVSLGYNYIIPRDNFSYLLTNMKKSDRKKEWIALMKHLYNNTPVTKQTDFQPGYNSLFSCFRRFEIKGPLSKKCELEYKFDKQKKIIKGERTIYKINFSPKKIESDEQRYYEGIFYVDSKTYQIRRIELQIAPFYSEAFKKWINKAKLNIDYKINNNQYFISMLKSYYKKENVEYWVKFKTLDDKIHSLNLSKKDKNAFHVNDINPMVKYIKEEWNTYNLTKVKDINDIKMDLGNNNSLEKQYVKNAGKPFYISHFPGYKKFDKKMNNIYKYVESKIKEYEEKYNFIPKKD